MNFCSLKSYVRLPEEVCMELQRLYDEARDGADSNGLLKILAAVQNAEVIKRHGNETRLIALELAGNPRASSHLLCEIVRTESLEACYRVANNPRADEAVMGKLYNRLQSTMPSELVGHQDIQEFWLGTVKSMIASDNLPPYILNLLSEGSLGSMIRAGAMKRRDFLKQKAGG